MCWRIIFTSNTDVSDNWNSRLKVKRDIVSYFHDYIRSIEPAFSCLSDDCVNLHVRFLLRTRSILLPGEHLFYNFHFIYDCQLHKNSPTQYYQKRYFSTGFNFILKVRCESEVGNLSHIAFFFLGLWFKDTLKEVTLRPSIASQTKRSLITGWCW